MRTIRGDVMNVVEMLSVRDHQSLIAFAPALMMSFNPKTFSQNTLGFIHCAFDDDSCFARQAIAAPKYDLRPCARAARSQFMIQAIVKRTLAKARRFIVAVYTCVERADAGIAAGDAADLERVAIGLRRFGLREACLSPFDTKLVAGLDLNARRRMWRLSERRNADKNQLRNSREYRCHGFVKTYHKLCFR